MRKRERGTIHLEFHQRTGNGITREAVRRTGKGRFCLPPPAEIGQTPIMVIDRGV